MSTDRINELAKKMRAMFMDNHAVSKEEFFSNVKHNIDFTEFFEKLTRLGVTYIKIKWSGLNEDAEDIWSEFVLNKFHINILSFNEEQSKFTTYFIGNLHKFCIDVGRKEKRRDIISLDGLSKTKDGQSGKDVEAQLFEQVSLKHLFEQLRVEQATDLIEAVKVLVHYLDLLVDESRIRRKIEGKLVYHCKKFLFEGLNCQGGHSLIQDLHGRLFAEVTVEIEKSYKAALTRETSFMEKVQQQIELSLVSLKFLGDVNLDEQDGKDRVNAYIRRINLLFKDNKCRISKELGGIEV